MSAQNTSKIIDTGYSYCFKENGEDIEISYCNPRAKEIRETINQKEKR